MKIRPSANGQALKQPPLQGPRSAIRLKPLTAHIRRALFPGLVLGLQVGTAIAGPEGGNVVGGSGSIARPNANTTVINQQSHNLAIDWQKFNVKSHELVQFNQPGRNAQALNRIFDQSASQIHGRINANGRVLLMNPNGVIFGRNSHVNVNGLVAAGMKNIPVDDFMAGKFKLEALEGADGAVVNHGTLEAATGGDITLVGKSIRNEGVILASAGRVNLAAGNKVTLDFDGDGLMRFAVDEKVLDNAQALDDQIANTGEISADGGDVIIAASAAQNVFTNAINNSGIVRAGRIENSGGTIRLVGLGPSASVLNTGTIDASAGDTVSSGGYVDITGADIRQGGRVVADAIADAGTVKLLASETVTLADGSATTAKSAAQSGGTVHTLGSEVTLESNARIDVSGATGGGVALVGGDIQGANPAIVNAKTTTVGAGASILADATVSGDGGTVVVWSDGTTTFDGEISARGGVEGGDGGFAEVSGKEHIHISGFADMRAPRGTAGTFLLDPGTVNICALGAAGCMTTMMGPDTISDDHINAQLLLASFTILTSAAGSGAEDIIVVDTGVSISWSANVLTMTAGRDITLDGTFAATGAATLNLNFGAALAGTLDLSAASIASATPITATGGAGNDTIIGPNVDVTWSTTAANSGTITWTAPSAVTINFTSVGDLQGGSAADTYNIGHVLTTGATGNGGNDVFNITADPGGNVSGNAGNDIFNVSATLAAGTGLDGGANDDTFNIQSNAITIADTIIGGSETDTVVGFNSAATWDITGTDAGDLIEPGGPTTVAQFSGIETLTGGTAVDTFNIDVNWGGSLNGDLGADNFTFADTVTVGGSIDGGAGTDTIDWSAYTADINITTSGAGATDGLAGGEASITGTFTNIDAVISNGNVNSSLQGPDGATNTWAIGNGVGTDDDGTLTSSTQSLDFTDVPTLVGGDGADDFVVSMGGTVNTIDGGSGGTDSLTGDSAAVSAFTINGADSGFLVGVVGAMSNIDTLNGTGMDDSFSFTTAAATWSGTLDGAGGSDSVDWGGLTSAINVVITDGDATGFDGTASSTTFLNIEDITGSGTSGTSGDSLTLTDPTAIAATWTLVGAADAGTLEVDPGGGPFTLSFTDFANLTGDSAVDTFNVDNVTGGDDLSGNIRGGGGNDIFNLDGIATIGGTIQGGAGAGDTVVGPNVANTWNISGPGAGDLGSAVTFSEIEIVQGGTDDDTFVVTSLAAGIFLDGRAQAAGDSIDWSGFGSAVDVILDSVTGDGFGSSSAGNGLSGFADIDIVEGDGASSLEGIAAGGVFNIDGIAATTNTYVSTSTLTFEGFNDLTGSATMADSFVFAAAGYSPLFSLDGGGSGAAAGTIDLSVDPTIRTYNLTSLNTGNVDDGAATMFMAFSNVGSLDAGGGDALDFSTLLPATSVTVNLQTLVATNVLDGTFSGFDDFTGHGASATLRAPDGGVTIDITAANAGNIGATTWGGFFNLEAGDGGASGDTFVFSGASPSVGGTITGDGTTGATLDYSDASVSATTVTVNLATSSATLTGGISNIDDLIGAGGNDILHGEDAGAADLFEITDADDGTLTTDTDTITFADFSFLESGNDGDTFRFNGASAAISGTITGDPTAGGTLDYSMMTLAVTIDLDVRSANLVFGGAAGGFDDILGFTGDSANDTLIGSDATVNTFTLTGGGGSDDGTLADGTDTFTFTDITDLQAGAMGDTFAFSGANTLSGDITGGGGTDTLDYSAATGGPLTFTVGSTMYPRVTDTSSIEVVIGTSATDTLNGTAAAETFTIDGTGVQIGGVSYQQIETVDGMNGADIFNITGNHTGDLLGNGDGDVFNLSGTAVVTGNLDGGGAVDTFNFMGSAQLIGQVIGGAPGGMSGDTLDFTGYTGTVTDTDLGGGGNGNLNGTATDPIVFGGNDRTGIETVLNVAVQGADILGVYLVNGTDSIQRVDDAVTRTVLQEWTSVSTFIGGNMDDTFIFTTTSSELTGSLDGGADTTGDVLTSDFAMTVTIDGANMGTIDPDGVGGTAATAFGTIENLLGGGMAGGLTDSFTFTAGGSLAGAIDGNGGAADTVTTTATGGITLNIDGTNNGIVDIDTVSGGGAGYTVAGGRTFTITGVNSGTVTGTASTVTFTNWANLTGTAGFDDLFNFSGGDISGTIDGLAGSDTADFTAHDTDATIALGGLGTVDGFQGTTITDAGGFDNIDVLTGRVGGTDSLTGRNATALWDLDGTHQYVSGNTLDFSDFEALVGGTDVDTFDFADGIDVTSIDGGAGAAAIVDVLDLADYSADRIWTINLDGGGTVDTPSTMSFADIEGFVGGMAMDTFNVTADTGLLNLFGATPGNVDGGGGATNTISFVGRTTAVTVELDNVSNITSITGGTGIDLITGTSVADTFTTSAADAGGITGGITLSYTSFETLGGGGGDDIFDIDHSVTSASGDAGADTFNLDTALVSISGGLFGGDNGDTFNIRANVATDIDGGLGDDIVNVDPGGTGGIVLTGDVSGGDNDDTINIGMPTMTPPAALPSSSRIVGQVDGGAGDDTLDYTGSSHAMVVTVTGPGTSGNNLEFTGATTAVDAAGDDVLNIDTVDDNRLGTLIGPNEDTTWTITGTNSGMFQGISAALPTSFTNFQIVGLGGADTFIFQDLGQIVGLAGGPGVVGGGVTGVGVDSIVVAATGALGPASEDIVLTASDEGTITTTAGITEFDLIQAIVGNDGSGTVLVQSAWAGSVDGGTGGSTIVWTALGDQSVTLSGGGTSGVGFAGSTATIAMGFDNITGLTNPGTTSTASLTGTNSAAATNTWTIMSDGVVDMGSVSLDGGGPLTLNFVEFDNLTGRDDPDTFTISGLHSGNISGGNVGTNNFVFTGIPATSFITGSVNGGSGVDVLDYSGFGTAIAISLTGGTIADGYDGNDGAATISSGFNNMDDIRGNLTMANSFTGIPGQDATWTITATDGFDYDPASAALPLISLSGFANLTGSAANDTFIITTGDVDSIDGGAGIDTLSHNGNAGPIAVALTALGTSNGFMGMSTDISGMFNNINRLEGSANTGDSLTGVPSGVAASATWTLDGTTYTAGGRTLTFIGVDDSPFLGDPPGVYEAIENLIGNDGADTFNVTADRTGDITGGAGNDVVNLAALLTGSVMLGAGNDTLNFIGTGMIVGAGNIADGGTEIASPPGDTIDWSLSSVDPVALSLVDITDPTSIDGTLSLVDGGAAGGLAEFESFFTNSTSTLLGPDTAITYTITGPNTFFIDIGAMPTFSGFSSITGGTLNDTFSFMPGGSLSGDIDGGGGVNSIVTAVLAAAPTGNFFLTTGANSGRLGTIDVFPVGTPVFGTLGGTWTNITNLTGGTGIDVFTITGGTAFAGLMDGGGGIDAIRADNLTNTWNLLGVGSGNIGGVGSNNFVNMLRGIGGTGADTFVFNDGASLDSLDGLGGTDTLDYSAVSTPITVNLATNNASLLTFAGGNAINIEAVVGTGGGGDTLIGENNNNSWIATAPGIGTVDGFAYSAIENISGGTAIDSFLIGAAGRVTGNLNGGGGIDTITQSFASNWVITSPNAGTTDGVLGTFAGVENLTATGSTANLDMDGGSISGRYTATTVTLNVDGTSVTGGTPVDVAGNLAASANQTITTGGGAFAVSGTLTGTGAGFNVNTGGGTVTVNGATNANSLIVNSGGSNFGAVTTTGVQTYGGSTTFRGDLTGSNLTFNGTSTFNGNHLLQSSTNVWDFNGEVLGTGNLDIIPTANTDIFIGNGNGPGNIASSRFGGFQGHLIVGAQLDPLDSPAEEAVVVMPPGVTADLITVEENFLVGGDVTLIGSNIMLDSGISGGAGTGQVTLIAVGDSQGTGGEGPGDIIGPTGGTAIIGGNKAVLVANNGIVNAGNIRLDLDAGELFLAVSASQDEPTFDASSSATSVSFDPTTIAIIASLGLNLQSVQVVFSNPASALTGLQNVQFIDVGLFEEELSLFGVIGNGIALSLDQCEEAEGCAPNVSEEEIDALIAQIEGRISEIERRLASGEIDSAEGQRLLAGFQQELQNYQTYKEQLAAFNESQLEFGDDFGELDDFAEEFDDAEPIDDVSPTDTTDIEAPQIAAPAPEPEAEPMEEAFEELEDEFIEQEIPVDEFEDLEEDLEEDFPELDDVLEEAPDEFEDLDEEFDEFEELGKEIDPALLLRLTQNANVNEYRGALGIGMDGRVVWTGDIILPSYARQY